MLWVACVPAMLACKWMGLVVSHAMGCLRASNAGMQVDGLGSKSCYGLLASQQCWHASIWAWE